MAATYDYKTGKVETDAHFVRYNEKCKLSGLPCYVGSDRCLSCKHNTGTIHPFSCQLRYGIKLDESYVMCNHTDAKDSENSGIARHAFWEMLQNEALCALCR
jgi:hypothetical protein